MPPGRAIGASPTLREKETLSRRIQRSVAWGLGCRPETRAASFRRPEGSGHGQPNHAGNKRAVHAVDDKGRVVTLLEACGHGIDVEFR